MRIEELKTETKKLLNLLEDPQPGLFTWHEAVHTHLKAILEGTGYWLRRGARLGKEEK